MEFKLSDHAKEQMEERNISVSRVMEVAKHPEQTYNDDIDETVCQSKVNFGEKNLFVKSFCQPNQKATWND